MSQTVVRLIDQPYDEGAFLVDWIQRDWKAQFTLPLNHPLSNHVRDIGCHRADIRLIVASTDEIEWHIDTTTWDGRECVVTCTSRAHLLKTCVLPDQFLLEAGVVA